MYICLSWITRHLSFSQGDWICLKCYHKEQMRMAATNANYNSNIVGVKRTTAVGDDQQETDVGFFFLTFYLLE